MSQVLAKISIRTLLSALIATLGVLLIGQSSAGLVDSYRRAQDGRRVAWLNWANAPVLAAARSARRVRNLTGEAMSADQPISNAAFANLVELRDKADQDYAAAIARLNDSLDNNRLPNLAALRQRMQSAHATALAGRPATDAELRSPLAGRDAKHIAEQAQATEELQQAIEAANRSLEDAMQWIYPDVDALLKLRQAGHNVRATLDAMTLQLQSTVRTRRSWTRADLAQLVAGRVWIANQWDVIENALKGPDATPAIISAAHRARQAYQAYEAGEQQTLLDILRVGRLPEVSPSTIQTRAEVVTEAVGDLAAAVIEAIIEATDARQSRARTDLTLHIGALTMALAGTVLGFILVQWRISLPIQRLTHTMGRMSQRDRLQKAAAQAVQDTIPGDGRRDEIGEMAGVLHVFRKEMLRGEELTALTAAQAAAEAKQAAEVIEKLAGMADRQGLVVKTLVSGLIQLSKGNLAFTLPTAPAETDNKDPLRGLFNTAVTGLQDTVRDVLNRTRTIDSGTTEIAQGSDDLARRTQLQAASLKQTAATLAEITLTVRQTADGSARAQMIAATARSEAETSARVVTQTVAAMEQIDGSAREIGQIIGLIDEIAFQTNLLALNAGVEAARAGDTGRGFGVIASEVRALAQRASGAANEITALVRTSMQNVERGVRLVGETGEALGRIQSSVIDIKSAIDQIAAAVQEQSSGLAEASETVNQMDQVTQQNATMVEQSTAATFALAQETKELGNTMEYFTIDAAPRLIEAA
jgi:methyl-accepting chemotaxis protein